MNDDKKKRLLKDVQSYLKAHYIPADAPGFFASPFIVDAALSTHALQKGSLSHAAKDALFHGLQEMLQPGFHDLLFKLIKKKGVRNVDLYRSADLTKAHFSRMKNDADYHPSKETVLALALGLKLTLDETKMLLERAGYTLTNSSQTDLIVEFFIQSHLYDVNEVNEVLDELGLPTITNHRKTKERKDDW